MKYFGIDPTLYSWAKAHGLYFYTLSKEETEVRSAQVVDDSGTTYTIDISAPKNDGSIEIVGWGLDHEGFRLVSQKSKLLASLEEAYSNVKSWIAQKGHTRTPVL